MNAIAKGRTATVVSIVDIPTDRGITHDLLIGYAMRAANETPARLFGWACIYNEAAKEATVQLHTD